jgi:hypothetical protein
MRESPSRIKIVHAYIHGNHLSTEINLGSFAIDFLKLCGSFCACGRGILNRLYIITDRSEFKLPPISARINKSGGRKFDRGIFHIIAGAVVFRVKTSLTAQVSTSMTWT